MSFFDEVDYTHKPLIALQYTFFTVVLLYWGRALFIPLSIALLISFILYPFSNWLEKFKISRIGSIFIGLLVFTALISALVTLLIYQFAAFMKNWPELSLKLNHLLHDLDRQLGSSWFKIFLEPDESIVTTTINYLSENAIPQLTQTLYKSSVAFILLVLIPVYVALILFYREVLVAFLYKLFPPQAGRYISHLIPNVIITYYNFIKGMGIVYLIVGILNSFGLFLLGVPNPIFFGFVASILTFIPYVGITIGAVLPMAVSWLKYDSLMYPIGVVIVFTVVQVLEANLIFPLAVSHRLKINALVTLIVIIAGGIIWGAMGMILFLPFVAILKLIADEIKELEPIAIFLGTKEDLNKVKPGDPKV